LKFVPDARFFTLVREVVANVAYSSGAGTREIHMFGLLASRQKAFRVSLVLLQSNKRAAAFFVPFPNESFPIPVAERRKALIF
jgi:hypothetical protein